MALVPCRVCCGCMSYSMQLCLDASTKFIDYGRLLQKGAGEARKQLQDKPDTCQTIKLTNKQTDENKSHTLSACLVGIHFYYCLYTCVYYLSCCLFMLLLLLHWTVNFISCLLTNSSLSLSLRHVPIMSSFYFIRILDR